MAISITKPTVGGSEDTWGTTINTALDAIVDEINDNADGTNSIAANLTEGSFKVGGTAVTATAAELNILDGVTSTTAELNILDGVTADASEINIMDGVTATTAELNILDGVTATAAEINLLDGGKASGWAINANGTTLEFKYNGTVRFKMTSTGTFQADDDVQAAAF